MPASSLYGSVGGQSIASMRSSRAGTITHSIPGSVANLKAASGHKWWQRRPILHSAYVTDLQKGSYYASIFTLIQSLVQIVLAIFDTYCLIEARPGSRHFRTFGFSFVFVYSGNEHVRRTLIAFSLILLILASYLLASSFILMSALRKEAEVKFVHWIRSMAAFIVFRTLSLFFSSLVNDLWFGYHQTMLLLWLILVTGDIFCFLIVVSNYQELSNITKLEDMAKLKMSTLSSLNASRSLSHHSLDSYARAAYGGVGMMPRGGGSTTGSLNSFNLGQATGTSVPGGGYGSIGNPFGSLNKLTGPSPTASSIPLSAFGISSIKDPSGIFTMEQLTGSTSSLASRNQSVTTDHGSTSFRPLGAGGVSTLPSGRPVQGGQSSQSASYRQTVTTPTQPPQVSQVSSSSTGYVPGTMTAKLTGSSSAQPLSVSSLLSSLTSSSSQSPKVSKVTVTSSKAEPKPRPTPTVSKPGASIPGFSYSAFRSSSHRLNSSAASGGADQGQGQQPQPSPRPGSQNSNKRIYGTSTII